MQVKDIMYGQLYEVDYNMSVTDIAKMLKDEGIGSTLVGKGKKSIGFITTKDLVTRVIAKGKNPDETTAEEIMSSPLIMIDAKADILEAADLLKKYKIKRLVVEERGRPVGIISTSKIGGNIKRIIKENS